MPVRSPRPAPWVKFPPGPSDVGLWAGTDLTRQPWWIHQMYCARLEWKWCLGALRWPRGNIILNPLEDIITGVWENADGTVTIECSGANWIGIGRNPWVNNAIGDPPPSSEAYPVWIPDGPSAYDIVVEVGPADREGRTGVDFEQLAVCDGARVVQAHVLSRDNSTTITVAACRDYVTSGQLASLSEMVGRPIYMIKAGGRWPVLRWAPWANAEELDRATVKAFTANSITFDLPLGESWDVNRYAPAGGQAYEVHVRDGAGFHRRIPIKVPASFADPSSAPTLPVASSAEGTVYFDTISGAAWSGLAGGVCVVTRAGERYRLGHEKHQPWRWYAGARAIFQSVHWNGGIGGVMVPAGGVTWSELDPLTGLCTPTYHPNAFDNDMWSEFEGHVCGNADHNYSPHVYKTLRQLQVDQDGDAGTAVEPKGGPQNGLPWMTLPILFRAAGVTSASSTASGYDNVTGDVTIAGVEAHHYPIRVKLTVHVYNGHDLAGSTLTQETTLYAPGDFVVNIGGGYTAEKVNGAQVDIVFGDITFGRRRFAPRLFLHMFPRSRWIPDTHPETGDVIASRTVVNWAEYGRTGVGKWIRREADTHYTAESGKAGVPEAFVNGEYARWVADGWSIPINGGQGGPLVGYFARFYSGRQPIAVQRTHVEDPAAGYTGRPDCGYPHRRLPDELATSRYRFCVPSKNFYNTTPMGGGYGHVETGTASAGGDTSFEDNSKIVGQLSGAFIDPEDWVDWSGGTPYVNFVIEFELPTELEILDPVTGEPTGETETLPVWHGRPLKTTSTAGGKFAGTWDEPYHTSVAGCRWRIREPMFTVRRWDGRRVLVADGIHGERTGDVLTNDDHWVYLKTPHDAPIEPASRYAVHDYQAGGVWKRQDAPPEDDRPYVRHGAGQYWVAPRGADVPRTGLPDVGPFHRDQAENEPTHVLRFGRIEINDQIRARHIYDDFLRIENEFRWRKREPSLLASIGGNGEGGVGVPGGDPDIRDDADANWTIGPISPAMPSAGAVVGYSPPGDWMADKARISTKFGASGIPSILAHTMTLWLYTGLAGDAEQDDVWDTTDVGETGDYHKNLFNPLGDPVAYRQWKEWSGGEFGGEARVGSRESDYFGGTGRPNGWPETPAAPMTDPVDFMWPSGSSCGWVALDAVCVEKWDGPNGRKMLLA